MRLDFIKMQGLGNDYIYVDCNKNDMSGVDIGDLARRLSDRNFGIGGDGLVLIEFEEGVDARMVMYNNDGSEGAMCGNAIRCVAKYLYSVLNLKKPQFSIATKSGTKTISVHDDGELFTVNMGAPSLLPKSIPVLLSGSSVINRSTQFSCGSFDITTVSMGNPHCVIFTKGIEDMDIARLGQSIQSDSIFPDSVNVEFAEVLSDNRIKMRVYERGTGETLACGTGACAVAVASVENGLAVGGLIEIDLRGGTLKIEYNGADVLMTGTATIVFSGHCEI